MLVHATRESIQGHWITHYAPAILEAERFEAEEATVAHMKDLGFSRVEVTRLRYDDAQHGSAQALKRFPETMLADERIMNTSLLSRLSDEDAGP